MTQDWGPIRLVKIGVSDDLGGNAVITQRRGHGRFAYTRLGPVLRLIGHVMAPAVLRGPGVCGKEDEPEGLAYPGGSPAVRWISR
jgi:hypothetical protein